jgi:DNA-binding PadR family transcriptional regulator
MDIKTFANVAVGPGTLYGVITRLEERGLIRPVPSGDRRQPYRLTAAGRKQLEATIASLETIVRVGSHRLKHA